MQEMTVDDSMHFDTEDQLIDEMLKIATVNGRKVLGIDPYDDAPKAA